MEGRFAKESEFDLVVSWRHDDVFFSAFEVDESVGLEEVTGTLGLDCEAFFEKKPRMLCCFPVDGGIALPFLAVEGVLAGVCFSDLSTIAGAECYSSIGGKYRYDTTENKNAQQGLV